jgi:cellulose biosynthesis protein BcsQ
MNFLFYSRKGGQGKTTHAIGFARHIKADFITNDFGNSTIEIFASLFKNKNQEFRELKPDEKIEIDQDKNNVFDFGGFLDSRIINVAKFVDACVVPIFYQSKADLVPAIQTILELEKYNKNITILINNTDKEYVDQIQLALSKKFKHKIFTINRSKYISRLSDEGKTIFDLFNQGKLEKYMLKNLVEQIKNFYSHLEKLGKK